jgi:hypothetical protein
MDASPTTQEALDEPHAIKEKGALALARVSPAGARVTPRRPAGVPDVRGSCRRASLVEPAAVGGKSVDREDDVVRGSACRRRARLLPERAARAA